MQDLQAIVDEIVEEVRAQKDHGRAADYIPELADADLDKFGLAIITREGETFAGGDSEDAFPIQSISKVFALTLALEIHGEDVWKRVGREPSGDPFNSIVDLERHKGFPRNPFINTGALVVVDMLLNAPGGGHGMIRDFLDKAIGEHAIEIDEAVAGSQAGTAHTNQALAHFAKSFDNLKNPVDDVVHSYIQQCSIALCCRRLAKAGRYLMLDGLDPASGDWLSTQGHTRRVASLMMTCGQYDGAGDFAFRVGLPAKSGVAGGILAIAPGTASIAVWSPGLDDNGNSLLGTLALEKLTDRTGWSVFAGRS